MGNSQRKIHGYRVVDKLGGGCFGTVYKSQTCKDIYAVKEIFRGKSASALETLDREGRIHEELPYHRNIVRFIECFRQDHRLYIVLEFCALGSLNDYAIRHELPQKTVLYIMFDLARGLQHMHRHGIVHRDIKPDNVLLSAGKFGIPTCKICDFGLARHCDSDGMVGSCNQDEPASDDGPMMYMAPEIITGQYSLACDVFSLGVLYYVMFSRQITEFKGRRLLEPHINGYPVFTASEELRQEEVEKFVKGQGHRDLINGMLRRCPDNRCSASEILDKLSEMFSQAMSDNHNVKHVSKVESNGYMK